jgi:hypothetical protein
MGNTDSCQHEVWQPHVLHCTTVCNTYARGVQDGVAFRAHGLEVDVYGPSREIVLQRVVKKVYQSGLL